jgi:hypothetical protein
MEIVENDLKIGKVEGFYLNEMFGNILYHSIAAFFLIYRTKDFY